MDLGEKIRLLRLQQGLTLEDVGNMVGVGKSTVRKWESGEIANMRRDKIALVAKALNVTPSYLMGWDDDASQTPLPANLKRICDMNPRQIPMIGSVAAGIPIIAEQEYGVFVDCPIKADFALTVQGDSMEPTYLDGDVIYIREQPDVPDGQVGVVLIDDSAALKHVYHIDHGLQLVSENPKYPPMIMLINEHEHLRILGIVVGYTRMYTNANPLKKVTKGMPKK